MRTVFFPLFGISGTGYVSNFGFMALLIFVSCVCLCNLLKNLTSNLQLHFKGKCLNQLNKTSWKTEIFKKSCFIQQGGNGYKHQYHPDASE